MKNRALLTIVTVAALATSLGACASTDSGSGGSSSSGSTSKKHHKQHWVRIATVKGTGDKASDTITTKGGKIRLTYTFKGDTILGALYFLKEGTDLQKDGGIPDVTISKSGTDHTILRKGAGKYYVNVVAANTTYTVYVAELR